MRFTRHEDFETVSVSRNSLIEFLARQTADGAVSC